MKEDSSDVIVIGSGGAGLLAAIEACDLGASVMLVSNGAAGKSGATMMAGADITLDGGGAASIGLQGNKSDSKDRFFHDILVQGYYLNNQKMVEAYVRDAPVRTKEMIDWGMKYLWDGKTRNSDSGHGPEPNPDRTGEEATHHNQGRFLRNRHSYT